MYIEGLANSQGTVLMHEGIMIGGMGHAKIEITAIIALPVLELSEGATGSFKEASIDLSTDQMSRRPMVNPDIRVATAGDPRTGEAV